MISHAGPLSNRAGAGDLSSMNILVLNVGSSSLKFQLVDTDGEKIASATDRRLARGQIERIGGEAIVTLSAEGHRASKESVLIRNHAGAVEHVIQWLTSSASGVPITRVADIQAVGHRVVHGGERFTQSTLIDDAVGREVEDLHRARAAAQSAQPARHQAARARARPGVPHVAVFDTAFHQSLPRHGVPVRAFPTYSTGGTASAATASTARRTATSAYR